MRQRLRKAGIVFVLFALCLGFGAVTITERPAEGAVGGARAFDEWIASHEGETWDFLGTTVLMAGGQSPDDEAFLAALRSRLEAREIRTLGPARSPAEARERLAENPDAILCTPAAEKWLVFDAVRAKVHAPRPEWGSTFLSAANLLNIANQVAVIAILAVGMTMVIIVRGIDLSVGSLIALSAVVTAWLIAHSCGGTAANAGGMLLASAAGVGVGAACGLISGALVAGCRVPAFIATLAIMQIASGAAFKISAGESINEVPPSFNWLGLQATAGLPHAVWLALLVTLAAHLLMTQTVLGRHIYAVGSNPDAARFSGISLTRVRLIVFALCGGLGGLGGVVVASQFTSGSPTYGQWAELDAIAAAVVGGTSLEGGRGNILGTLVGALIIAVIRNGMNLTGVDPYMQKIWLGLVILAAVLLDRWSRRSQAQMA